MFRIPGMGTRTVVVVPLTREHLRDAADIHAASFADAWGDGTLANLLDQKGVEGFAARSGNGPIGGFLICRRAADEVEVITIATARRSRRKGIASALMSEMIRKVIADRMDRIFLEVDENNQAARKLYARLGFKKVGERRGYYGRQADQAAGGAGNALILRLDLKS